MRSVNGRMCCTWSTRKGAGCPFVGMNDYLLLHVSVDTGEGPSVKVIREMEFGFLFPFKS